jgi:hypothetical protein
MKFLRLPLCVLTLWLSSMAGPYSRAAFAQESAQKPAAQADQAPARADQAPMRPDQMAKEIILIGELHGTQETPRLFGNLVTIAASEKNKRTGVGLELPIGLQRLIDEALKNNTKIDLFRAQLRADPAWQKIDDGRSSQAMLDLICNTLKLAESGKVSLFFFDTETNERDQSMAQFIGQRLREQRYDATLILAGNIHANTAPRHPLKSKVIPMGHWLEEQGFTVHSYDVGYSEGEAWACTPDCGVHHFGGWNVTPDPAAKEQQGYDGILFVGAIHASPPARDSLLSKPAK